MFHVDARSFGFLSSTMAVGTIFGALLAARRDRLREPVRIFVGEAVEQIVSHAPA
ncbi:hypothetical protein [Burkholderia ubonensis]|uniref:hypothetical protein n=1 Tax=Burkholderia ubonensis TaxID=101571 RepID=UPI0012F8929B|nr:hypothetical protein [Burkholderia ubonensis]